jgi:hypothetical protein
VTDVLNNQHRIQARTALQPSQASDQFELDRRGEDGRTFSYQRIHGIIDTTLVETGRNRASVWAFGANYLTMFQRQLETYASDRAANPDANVFGDADGDGRVVLTNRSVVEDFQSAFMVNVGFVDGRKPPSGAAARLEHHVQRPRSLAGLPIPRPERHAPPWLQR